MEWKLAVQLVPLTLGLSGCGLVFLGTKQEVSIVTTPPGATVVAAEQVAITPVRITVRRNLDWLVVRASKEGYQSACEVAEGDKPNLLVFLDAIPLALPLLVDRLAGALYEYPEEVQLELEPIPEGSVAVELPSYGEILDTLRHGRQNLCDVRRSPLEVEVWEAKYEIVLARVDKPAQPGARYGSPTTVEVPKPGEFTYHDQNVEFTLVPRENRLDFELANRTSHAMKVPWDEVVFIDFNQTSHRVMHEGVRYVDRNLSQPPSVVAPGKLLRDTIVPVNRVFEEENRFYHRPIVPDALRGCTEPEEMFLRRARAFVGKSFGVMLPIEFEGRVNEYTLNFELRDAKLGRGVQCLASQSVSGQDRIIRRDR